MTTKTITLDQPIPRANGEHISTITLRKPGTRDLRGVSLISVLQMDVDAIATVATRTSTPILFQADIDKMDAADLLELAVGVTSFFQRKESKGDQDKAQPSESPTA